MKIVETDFWPNARQLIQFIGICGAGKTTMSGRMVGRCRAQGGTATSTLDWDPHVPDQDRLPERAFRRDLDLANIAKPADTEIHRMIVQHSLQMIADWQQSKSNLVVVDRFIESYDNLPDEALHYVQDALAKSGFRVSQVLLAIGLEDDSQKEIAVRLEHTRAHRPAQWWATTPKDVYRFAADEAMCQAAYRRYCTSSPFDTAVINTSQMAWPQYEQVLVDRLMRQETARR